MTGNTPAIGTGMWSFVSGPNTPVITAPSSPSATINGLIPGTYTFRWTITNGSCSSNDDVLIIINSFPTTAVAGPDQELCVVTSTTMAGNAPVTGIGQWSLVSGPNTPTITDPALNNTTITGLIPGTYIFRWTITNWSIAHQVPMMCR